MIIFVLHANVKLCTVLDRNASHIITQRRQLSLYNVTCLKGLQRAREQQSLVRLSSDSLSWPRLFVPLTKTGTYLGTQTHVFQQQYSMGIPIRIPIKFPSSPIVLVDVHDSDFYFPVTCICRIRAVILGFRPFLNIHRILLISSAEELQIALILFYVQFRKYSLSYSIRRKSKLTGSNLVMNYISIIIPKTFLAN